MFKLLQTGHSLASLAELRKQGLHQGVFPLLDAVLSDAPEQAGRRRFVELALADTDRRVGEGKPVAPSFLLACLLWHDVLEGWNRLKSGGEAPVPALQQAIDAVFEVRVGEISGRGKLGADMREIWLMQLRFERRVGNGPFSLVEQPRFRAGFDFLRLRADAGEGDAALAEWWEDFSLDDDDARRALIEDVRRQQPKQRQRTAAAAGGDIADLPVPEDSAAPERKRRRRRRKPATPRPEGDGNVALPVDSPAG
jgi:poly(A) polymerase